MAEDKGIRTDSLTGEQEKLLNPPMAGVEARPLHRGGICDIHVEGGICPAGGKETNLWRVGWGDGVEKDLCTACMASLVFEECWTPAARCKRLASALAGLLGLVETLDGGEHQDAPEIAAARALVSRGR